MASTIGVDFKVKYVQIENQKVKLTMYKEIQYTFSVTNKRYNCRWDTAGQERFRTLTSSYYRGSNGVILVYDVSNRESFENITNIWFPELDVYTPTAGIITMIVGNKMDKASERVVSRAEGLELARNRGALFMECSAKSSK